MRLGVTGALLFALSSFGIEVPVLATEGSASPATEEAAVSARPAASATGASPEPPAAIRDNSFLLEEAYNQEAGVIQHINSFFGSLDNRDWLYTFTQEWPIKGQKNQLSYTLTLTDPGRTGGETGPGDMFLNYRYQVAGGGPERVAFAPRVSLLIPTGDEKENRGFGHYGVFVNLPLSVDFTPTLVGHSNLGAGWIPSAKDADGNEADLKAYFVGQSLVWLARPDFNLLIEAVWASEEEIASEIPTEVETDRSSSFFVNPGMRWAIDLPSGLQIVPGISFPIGLGSSRGEEAVLLYLSFEHPFASPRD
ncbi:MAG TPA: transporter [Candidatus Polarisedimenticolia bacterium]|nr:transporter [Candidatus Polarisedimenticolia bacterium]